MLTKYERRTFNAGDVIFKEGDAADCMYKISYGTVDIVLNYGKKNQKVLTTLQMDQFFGEMALIDDAPRSATAIAKGEGTSVTAYPKEYLSEMIREQTPVFRDVLSQMSENLVHLTDNYLDVCRVIADYKACDEAGKDMDENLKAGIDKYASMGEDL